MVITMTNTLGSYLKRELRQRGISQRQASIEWDIPLTTLNGLVRDESEPSLSTLRKLSDGLSVSVVRLLELSGVPSRLLTEDEAPAAWRALTEEDRKFIDSLTVQELREFVDLVRRLRQS